MRHITSHLMDSPIAKLHQRYLNSFLLSHFSIFLEQRAGLRNLPFLGSHVWSCNLFPQSRLSTEKEITTLERIWSPLFDEESRPTLKLGQLLRGLALHVERIACVGSVWGMSSNTDFVECRLKIMSRGTVSSSHRQRWHNTTRMSSCRRKCTRGRVCVSSSGNEGSHR